MSTIFTVGVGGTHSTVQAAYDAIPSTLADQYIIRLKKQEFVTTGSTSVLNISGRTTTSTFNIIIEPEPGAGFADDPNDRINPLRYDASRGAAIRSADASVITLSGTVNYLTIRGIQIKQAAGPSSSFDVIKCLPGFASTNLVFKDLIVELTGSDNNDIFFLLGTSDIINCLIIHAGNNPDSAIKLSDTAAGLTTRTTACTVVRPSNLAPGSASIGLHNKFNENIFIAKNCVSMGFFQDAVALTPGSDYNATNFSSGASGLPSSANNVYSVPNDTTTFEQPSSASGAHDFRTKRGSTVENKGLLDAVNSPADISGLARGNPPDLGAWEIEPLFPLSIDDRTIALPNAGQTITGIRLNPVVIGDDFRVKRAYTGLPTGVVILKAWLTVKKSFRLTDAQALMNKSITTAETIHGRITDADTTDGILAIYFDLLASETITALPDNEYFYGIKVKTIAGQIHTLEEGSIPFTRRATEAIV